jgi:hypothetical protein
MRQVLLSVLALLFMNFAAQVGVIRGVLLNDDEPQINKGY